MSNFARYYGRMVTICLRNGSKLYVLTIAVI